MQLNLFAKLALLLALLTSTALAVCYTSGDDWSAIGDDNDITGAFNDLCSHMAGNYKLHDKVEHCTNVGNNRIEASITISRTDNYTSTSDATLCEDICKQLLGGVKSLCRDKGGLQYVGAETGPEFHEYGYIWGEIKADPNRGKCSSNTERSEHDLPKAMALI